VPKLGLMFDVREGEQTIEFTPQEAGVIPWSCWMGMIPGSFVVQAAPAAEETSAPDAGQQDRP